MPVLLKQCDLNVVGWQISTTCGLLIPPIFILKYYKYTINRLTYLKLEITGFQNFLFTSDMRPYVMPSFEVRRQWEVLFRF